MLINEKIFFKKVKIYIKEEIAWMILSNYIEEKSGMMLNRK